MLDQRMMNAPRPYAPAFRRIRYAARYLCAFVLAIVADPAVVLRKGGGTIIWGKMRRTMIGWVPGLAFT